MSPGAGLSYPALARRHSSVGEDKASCMTRISLARPGCWQGKHTLTIFQTHLEYTQGLPGWDSNFSNMSRFSALYTPELEAKPGVELLMWNLSNVAKESSLLGHVIQQSLPKSFPWQRWDSNPRPRRDWSLNPAPLDRSATLPAEHVLHGSLRLGIVRPDADFAKKLQSNPLCIW